MEYWKGINSSDTNGIYIISISHEILKRNKLMRYKCDIYNLYLTLTIEK